VRSASDIGAREVPPLIEGDYSTSHTRRLFANLSPKRNGGNPLNPVEVAAHQTAADWILRGSVKGGEQQFAGCEANAWVRGLIKKSTVPDKVQLNSTIGQLAEASGGFSPSWNGKVRGGATTMRLRPAVLAR
jgi:hypothetical protein